jgi:hypothetical protein
MGFLKYTNCTALAHNAQEGSWLTDPIVVSPSGRSLPKLMSRDSSSAQASIFRLLPSAHTTNNFYGKHTTSSSFYTPRDVVTRMRLLKLTQLTYMPKGTCYENLDHLPWVLCDSRCSCTFVDCHMKHLLTYMLCRYPAIPKPLVLRFHVLRCYACTRTPV